MMEDPPPGIAAGPVDESNYFLWEAVIMGPEDTYYEGGVFTAILTFPSDYPMSPPKMRFTCPMWHPNSLQHKQFPHHGSCALKRFHRQHTCMRATKQTVFANGDVCISILHPPGADPNQYESITERWSPVQSVEKILLSVVSMLSEPNDESPANVDAAKMWRTDKEAYAKRVRHTVELSLNAARQITEKQ